MITNTFFIRKIWVFFKSSMNLKYFFWKISSNPNQNECVIFKNFQNVLQSQKSWCRTFFLFSPINQKKCINSTDYLQKNFSNFLQYEGCRSRFWRKLTYLGKLILSELRLISSLIWIVKKYATNKSGARIRCQFSADTRYLIKHGCRIKKIEPLPQERNWIMFVK